MAAIARVCAAHDVPLAAAALQFVLGHPAVASVIPGARSRSEVEAIAAWMEQPIPDGLWRDLKATGLIRADAPRRGSERQPARRSKSNHIDTLYLQWLTDAGVGRA